MSNIQIRIFEIYKILKFDSVKFYRNLKKTKQKQNQNKWNGKISNGMKSKISESRKIEKNQIWNLFMKRYCPRL